MQLQIKGKNLEVSDSIRTYAERKLAKLDKQLHELTQVEVELAVEKNPSVAANQVAEATVWLKGHTLRAREATRDMKASIDELVEKIGRQIREERDKKTARRKSVEKHAPDPGVFDPGALDTGAFDTGAFDTGA
jgi:putative sigma-54 modulation protein